MDYVQIHFVALTRSDWKESTTNSAPDVLSLSASLMQIAVCDRTVFDHIVLARNLCDCQV